MTVTVSLGSILNAAHRAIHPYTPGVDVEIRRVIFAHLRQLRKLQASRHAAHQRRRKVYWVSNSSAARLCAVLLAHRKHDPKATLQEFKNRAGKVNLRKPTGEPIRSFPMEKADGGTRPITSFASRARANRQLLTNILHAIWPPSEFEFCRRGLGREAAIRKGLHHIRHRGVRHIGLVDIETFFPSFDHTGVIEAVPLPRAMVRHNLLISPDDPVHLTHTLLPLHSSKTVRAGIPHGSQPSPLIASKILESCLQNIGARALIGFVDNIWLGGRTKKEVAAKIDALASLLKKHPVGPFRMKEAEIVRLGDDADFLGYWFRHERPQRGGYGRVTPSKKSICRSQRHLARALILTPANQHEAIIERWSQEWARRYPCWEGRKHGGDVHAYIAAFDYVLPFARKVRKSLQSAKLKWRSFKELWGHVTAQANKLQPDPSYQPASHWTAKALP